MKRPAKLAKRVRKKEKKEEIINTIIKRGIILQIMQIPKKIRGYNEHIYANIFENMDEMEKFLEKQNC